MLGIWRSDCGQIFGGAMRLIVVFFACVLVCSCQTAAHRQSVSIQEGSQSAQQRAKDCFSKITANPAYKSFAQHMPLSGTVYPTLTQLADDNLPTAEDAKIIIALHNDMAPCRERLIEDTMKINPGFIPTMLQFYNGSDLIMVNLMQRKITWGEANKNRSALINDFMAKMQVVGSQIDRELAASNQAELAQRQAALNALSQWANQQQVLMQNQQMIVSFRQGCVAENICQG
jgi:hypothetical protein